MNYQDYFKSSKAARALGHKIMLPEGVDPEQLKKGIKTEKEHTKDVGIAAKIALDHLREDPKYYDKLCAAGLEENGGIPLLGGALAVPHVGQPIHMSKIIQIGKSFGVEPKSGNLSGYTEMNPRGVTKDSGGIPAISQGDKEPITAGGHKVANAGVVKSVGGPVSPGEGQKQGGPNSQGTIANTAKMAEGKQKIRSIVKEVLKEITFDKKSGKWVRLTESQHARMFPDDPNAQTSAGFFGTDKKLSSHRGPWPKQPEAANDSEFLKLQKKLKDTGVKEFEENGGINELGGHYCFKCKQPTEVKFRNGKSVCKKCGKPLDYSKDVDLSDPKGVEDEVPRDDAYWMGKDESVDMKMGPSYKKVQPRQYKVQDDDFARTNQYDPEITEMCDEEELDMMKNRMSELTNAKRTLSEDEIAELNELSQKINEGRCEDYPCCGHEDGDCPDSQGRFTCVGCGKRLPRDASSSICPKCQRNMSDREDPFGNGGGFGDSEYQEGVKEGWAIGGYTPQQQQAINALQSKGFHEVSSFPGQPDADGGGMDDTVTVVLQRKNGQVRLSVEVDPDGSCNGQPVENFLQQNMEENVVNMKMGPAYKKSARQARVQADDQARTVQYDPEMTEDNPPAEPSDMELQKALDDLEQFDVQNPTLAHQRRALAQPGQRFADPEDVEVTIGSKIQQAGMSDLERIHRELDITNPNWQKDFSTTSFKSNPTDDTDKYDDSPYVPPKGGRPELTPDYAKSLGVDPDTFEKDKKRRADKRAANQAAGQSVEPDDADDDDDDDEKVDEAGIGATQHSSYRTVNHGNLAQDPEVRWADDLDEKVEPKNKPPKESETVKQIKKSQKVKPSAKPDQFKYKTPRLSKSGVHKKKP